MSQALRMIFLLDSPNVWRGQALAGTPARTLALARSAALAGADVTLVLGDRGADYGSASDWLHDVLVVHPQDFYAPRRLANILRGIRPDVVVQCEAEALVAMGRELAQRIDAVLVYDVHDDDAAVAASLGSSADVVSARVTTQRAALRAADRVVVSTRNEAVLAARSGVVADDVAMVPNGADIDDRRFWGPDPAAFTLLFLGNLYYEPNARAVESIRTEILPAARSRLPQVQARVVGQGPFTADSGRAGVHFTGRVESIDDATWGVSLALAPLKAGSGAKMKTLDYLAAGLPVLGTSESVTGLPIDHEGVVVEDDLARWPQLIDELLHTPDRLFALGRAGRQTVEEAFDWNRLGQSLVECCRRWGSTPSQRGQERNPVPGTVPLWFAEHRDQDALGSPTVTRPGGPWWVQHANGAAPASKS